MTLGPYDVVPTTSIIIISIILHGKYNWNITLCPYATIHNDHGDEILPTITLLVLMYQVSLQKYFKNIW